MNNDLTFENAVNSSNREKEMNIIEKLKTIGNDSLFYFGIFLVSFALLQFFPYISGIFSEFTIGINEVLVSFIGFVNVFFFQVFNKIFCKAN